MTWCLGSTGAASIPGPAFAGPLKILCESLQRAKDGGSWNPLGEGSPSCVPLQEAQMASCVKCGRHPLLKNKHKVFFCRRCGPRPSSLAAARAAELANEVAQ